MKDESDKEEEKEKEYMTILRKISCNTSSTVNAVFQKFQLCPSYIYFLFDLKSLPV